MFLFDTLWTNELGLENTLIPPKHTTNRIEIIIIINNNNNYLDRIAEEYKIIITSLLKIIFVKTHPSDSKYTMKVILFILIVFSIAESGTHCLTIVNRLHYSSFEVPSPDTSYRFYRIIMI